MTRQTKLLTSCARNDAAVGRFWGFLSTLFLFFYGTALASGLWPTSISSFKLLLSLWVLPVLAVGAPVVGIFQLLQHRFPDFARGYGSAAMVTACFCGALLMFWNIRFLTELQEDKVWSQRHQAQGQSEPVGAQHPNLSAH